MTREEAIDYLTILGGIEGITANEAMALEIAIEALEQEPVLDKIRSEIQEHINYNKKMNYQGIVAGLLLTLAIIDKYKGEIGDI